MTKASLSKKEIVSKREDIKKIFRAGTKIKTSLLWAYYTSSNKWSKIFVSIPKRNIKKAHDRNLLKRRIKESYRRNKEILTNPFHIAIVYQDKNPYSYKEIELEVQEILKNINISKSEPTC